MPEEVDDVQNKRRRFVSVVTALAVCDGSEEGAAHAMLSDLHTVLMRKSASSCPALVVGTPFRPPTTATVAMVQRIPPTVACPRFSHFIALLEQEPHAFYTNFRMTKELFWNIVQVRSVFNIDGWLTACILCQDCVPWFAVRNGAVRRSAVPSVQVREMRGPTRLPLLQTEEAQARFVRSRLGRAAFQIAVLLLYLASKSEQRVLAQICGVQQPAISKALVRASDVLLLCYGSEGENPQIGFHAGGATYIRDVCEPSFRAQSGIPYIAYIIDGTHIAIGRPNPRIARPREFQPRKKGYEYSLNTMIVCDHRKRIVFMDPVWPGSVNDKGAVSRSHLLRHVLCNRPADLFPAPYMMLADSGFHQRAFWLMPFENLEDDNIDVELTGDLKAAFNYALTSTRVLVENAIGLLKGKWRRLQHHVILENTDRIPALILCAGILHNMCIDANCVTGDEEIPRTPADKRLDRASCGLAHANVNADADNARAEFKQKRAAIAKFWARLRGGESPPLADFKAVFGPHAHG